MKVTHSPDSSAYYAHSIEILSDNLMVWFGNYKEYIDFTDKFRRFYHLYFFDGVPFNGKREDFLIPSNEIGHFRFHSTEGETEFPDHIREMIITELGRVFGTFPNFSAMIKELPEILDKYVQEMNGNEAYNNCKLCYKNEVSL